MQLIPAGGWRDTPGPSVGGDRVAREHLNKGRFILPLLFLCTQAIAQTAAEGEPKEDFQRAFEQGLSYLVAGDYENAKIIFSSLYDQTGSLRVKLEWARTVFLAKDYEAARSLFQAVFDDKRTPDIVRFNVSLFLNEIASLADESDYRLTFVRDTNPFGAAPPQKILIFGVPFDYRPLDKTETLNGLNFMAQHSMALLAKPHIRAVAEIDWTEYEGSNNTKIMGKLSLHSKFKREDDLGFRIGYENYQQKNSTLASQSFISLNYQKDLREGFFNKFQAELRRSQIQFPGFSLANGDGISANASGSKTVSRHLQLSLGAHIDEHRAQDAAYSYKTHATTVDVRIFAPQIRGNIQITALRSQRNFRQEDALFLLKRADQGTRLSLTYLPYSVKIFDMYPSLQIRHEKTTSSIPINALEKEVFNFSLRKSY